MRPRQMQGVSWIEGSCQLSIYIEGGGGKLCIAPPGGSESEPASPYFEAGSLARGKSAILDLQGWGISKQAVVAQGIAGMLDGLAKLKRPGREALPRICRNDSDVFKRARERDGHGLSFVCGCDDR